MTSRKNYRCKGQSKIKNRVMCLILTMFISQSAFASEGDLDGVSFFIYLGLCFWVSSAASNKGRGGITWFVIAILFSPILAGIVLAMMSDLKVERNISKVNMNHQQLKDRVVTNEKLHEYRLDVVESHVDKLIDAKINKTIQNDERMRIENTDTKPCPICLETIKLAAIKCKHCGSMLNEIETIECPFCSETIPRNESICKHCKSEIPSKSDVS